MTDPHWIQFLCQCYRRGPTLYKSDPALKTERYRDLKFVKTSALASDQDSSWGQELVLGEKKQDWGTPDESFCGAGGVFLNMEENYPDDVTAMSSVLS